ncbi:MAG: prolyl oligopeptidase family serine peptidase [Isosphaeraceae bacterium]
MMLRTLARSLFCGLLFSSFLGARADDLAAQPVDADYTAKIREYTTEPFFLTELVDHLPLSDRVPSPKKALGYVVGTPEKLTYSKGINAYFRALAAASPRVKVWTIGKSEGGREMILAAVSSEENMGRIDHYKQITAKLADPRKTTDAERADLVRESRPFYWLSGSIHSPETGSPEMLMELAFRLAVDESAHVQAIRNNLIVLFTPVVEVDGRDRMLDVYRYRKANPGKQTPGLVYWGQYVAHDNNRDAMGLALALSNVMLKTFLDWHPQVFHDLHESVPYLYTSTGTGPYNSWLDPIVVSEWQKLAYHEIEGMTRRGVPGVWTHGFYDGWAPNYMFYMANGHNAIGRFYETFGNGGADTRERKLPASATSRTWYRPNPPLPRVKWSIRNNINLQESALLLALKYVGDNREEFVNNFALKSQRSVAKARTEGPAAWIIPNDGKRPALAAQLARLLQRQGAEVHRLDRETEVKVAKPAPPHGGPAAPSAENRAPDSKAETAKPTAQKVAAGSYVVRMDQPYSRIVDMMLDTQYYSTTDPRPYDDTGWTFGPLRNVVTLRVVDPSILGAPMTKIDGEARAAGGVLGSGSAWFVLNANAEPALATLRFRLKDVKMFAAEEPFEVEGKKYSAGSFLIPSAGNPEDLRSRLQAATTSLGLRARAVGSEIRAKRHAISVPRIALLHTWVSTQNDGWFRLALDECEVPYSYISDQDIRATPDLKAKYDVIIFPPVTSSLPTLINGVRKRLLDDGSDFGGPVPFKSTGLTPNLGGIDDSDDIRGGLGFEGLAHLKAFVERGGVFIPVTASAALPVGLGMVEHITIAETRQLQASGSVLRARVQDKRSPIAYGYDDTVALYFNQAPVFRVSLTGGGGFGRGGGGGPGGESAGRPSGRGSATDADIPQGRPLREFAPDPVLGPAERELHIEPEMRELLAGTILPARMWPRVVVRWSDEKDLWVSGMLAGGSELAGTPAVIDVPLGKGHIVLFGNNPMWRHETHGSFMLLFNTALHYDHLQSGRREPSSDKRLVRQYTIQQFLATTAVSGPSFSRDGSRVLFTSDASGIPNAYTVPFEGGPVTPLTRSTKETTVAVSFFPRDERVLYTHDQGGDENNHLYVLGPRGDTDLTPGAKLKAMFSGWSRDDSSLNVLTNERDPRFFDLYRYDTARLARTLVYKNTAGYQVAAVSGDGRWVALGKPATTADADIYVWNTRESRMTHLTPHKAPTQYRASNFDPDSKWLYYLTNAGGEFIRVRRYELATGKHEDVESAGWDIQFAQLSRNGRYRVSAVNEDGRTVVRVHDTQTGRLIPMPKLPEGDVTSVVFSRDEQRMVVTLTGDRSPPNLYSSRVGSAEATRLTDSLCEEIDPEDLVESRVVRFQASDGLSIPSILYKPHQASPENKVPALVWVHGGPGGQTRKGYSAFIQYLVNHGYAVLGINNRGSSGYGQKFCTADDRKHGREPLRDCVEAKAYLAGMPDIDPDRIGIIGGSYGGYMVLAALAFQPETFAAGVDLFGVSNWLRTLKSMPPYWEAQRLALYQEIGDPVKDREMLRAISPVFHAEKICRPLLVLQGQNDPRVIKPESDDIVAAVKKNGVPVEYIIFADEGHGFTKKKNQIEGYSAVLKFLDKYLKGSGRSETRGRADRS